MLSSILRLEYQILNCFRFSLSFWYSGATLAVLSSAKSKQVSHSVPLWQDTCRRVQEAVPSALVWSKDRAKWWRFDTNLRFPARRSRCNLQTVRRHTAEWTWWKVRSHGLQGFLGGDDTSEVAAAAEVLRSVSSERKKILTIGPTYRKYCICTAVAMK